MFKEAEHPGHYHKHRKFKKIHSVILNLFTTIARLSCLINIKPESKKVPPSSSTAPKETKSANWR